MSSLSAVYRIAGALFGFAGILFVFVLPVSDVKHGVVAGVAVFAVLYVIAQAVERIVEFVVALLKQIPDSPGQKKEIALRRIGEANSTLNGNPTTADIEGEGIVDARAEKQEAEEEVDSARTDIAFVGLGLSILLAGLAVNALNYGIFVSLGTTGVDRDLDRLFTALAAAGGSKALHELVGRLQKAKEESAVAAKTA